MGRATRFTGTVGVADEVANSSDKTLVVPARHEWGLGSLYVKLVTTATVGNRQLDVLITDPDNLVVAHYVAGAVQAASLTREYVFAPLHPQETAFTSGVMLRSFPQAFIVPAGYKLRVWDSAAIDPTADDLTIRMLYEDMQE